MTKMRKNATGIVDTAMNIRSDKATKGWSSKYRPRREFINATTCGGKNSVQLYLIVTPRPQLVSEKQGNTFCKSAGGNKSLLLKQLYTGISV